MIMNQKQTQCKRIIDYIRQNGHITSYEAYAKLDITQLAARITDLESCGFEFNRPRYKVGNCKRPVAHYSIAKSGIEP
jgi:hypothetical protein